MDGASPRLRRRPDVAPCAFSLPGSRPARVSCEKFRSKASLDRDHRTERRHGQRISALAAVLVMMPARQQAQQPFAPIDWKQLDAGLGKSGTLQPDGAYKVDQGAPVSTYTVAREMGHGGEAMVWKV